MKKILLILLFIFLTCPAFSKSIDVSEQDNTGLIKDELLESKFFQYSKTEVARFAPINDELLEPRKVNSTLFKMEAYKSENYNLPIEDELITDKFIAGAMNSGILNKEIFDDEFFEKRIDINRVRKIKSKNKYDFTKKLIPVNIKLAQKYTHKLKKSEGDVLEFIAQNDFVIDNKKYERGTSVWGRIETLSESDKMGTPESIKIDNFYIKGEPEINLNGSISKNGANRSYWVYPLYQAGNVCLYVAGFVFVPIHGGRVKLSTDDIYTVFYETP